nr:integrase, catalytic region, zinc finger, CCHC-type, peptidase aspartic, catalytic [Tanacetum cinerariifolium]
TSLKVLSDSEASSSFADEKISEEKNNEFNEQIKVLNEKNDDLLDKMKVLKDQLQVKHVMIDTHVECHEKYAKLEAERYEYMIRYSALFDNDKQHRKHIADQEVLFDKMSVELVELDKHVRDLKNTILEKDFKISELKECMRNKDLEIEKCLERLNVCENKLHKMGQTNQTVHMIMPSKDNLYNGRKGIDFENPSYFEKANDLRPTLYDEKVIGLGYTLVFLTHSGEALEIEKFKRSKENKIEFAYDYGNLNASYVNEKINFEDDYFQDIINPDFEKIDSPFQQTSSLKPYVPNVILEKIKIDMKDEVVSLLEKEKANLETIESLKSKGSESSENVSCKSENQTENDCLVVEKEYDKDENPKVIAPGMFKLNVSQCVSPISISESSCDSKNVEIKLKRKRRKRKSSKQNVKEMDNDFLGTVRFGNNDFAMIAGYGDMVIGSMTIKKVYYVIGLGYTPMFLTHSNEALEIEKFKRSRENKIKFAYDYGNLNASYVNEKINFEDDYFQDIINPDFEKIDSPFQQSSSLKPYVPNVILEKIIIDLEDEVVSLLEKEKANLETIESLKSKCFESSENVSSESKNQSEKDCLVVGKECVKEENPKVIAPGMFKLNVSQSVSPILMSKSSCDSKNVEIKLKRKRRKRKSSKQNVKQVDNDVSCANNDFVHL